LRRSLWALRFGAVTAMFVCRVVVAGPVFSPSAVGIDPSNHGGLESAEPDLQSVLKKPGADTASLGDGKRFKRFASAEVNTDSGRCVVAAVQTWGLSRAAWQDVESRFPIALGSPGEGCSRTGMQPRCPRRSGSDVAE